MMMKFGRKHAGATSREARHDSESMSEAIGSYAKRGGSRDPRRMNSNAGQKRYVFMTR